ncbi:MAG: hypothetical protein FWD32_02430, partial [Firmicutes bacterium]|nr:hypothetical protein [Bacillota bacterium]
KFIEELSKKHKVTVVFPQESLHFKATAFSFSHKPIRVRKFRYVVGVGAKEKEIDAYKVFGMPADLLSVMVRSVMADQKIDLVICGPNNGNHMGQGIFTSSNCGMAREATMLGVKAIAIGLPVTKKGENIPFASEFILKNLELITNIPFHSHSFLNINFPIVEKYSDIKGVKISESGDSKRFKNFLKGTDPKGDPYYWTFYTPYAEVGENNNDIFTTINDGYISINASQYFLHDNAIILAEREKLEKSKKGVLAV